MARSGCCFHLVFILLPLLISGQVDSVDKLDPVDKACEEGISCVHKNECEGDYHHHKGSSKKELVFFRNIS